MNTVSVSRVWNAGEKTVLTSLTRWDFERDGETDEVFLTEKENARFLVYTCKYVEDGPSIEGFRLRNASKLKGGILWICRACGTWNQSSLRCGFPPCGRNYAKEMPVATYKVASGPHAGDVVYKFGVKCAEKLAWTSMQPQYKEWSLQLNWMCCVCGNMHSKGRSSSCAMCGTVVRTHKSCTSYSVNGHIMWLFGWDWRFIQDEEDRAYLEENYDSMSAEEKATWPTPRPFIRRLDMDDVDHESFLRKIKPGFEKYAFPAIPQEEYIAQIRARKLKEKEEHLLKLARQNEEQDRMDRVQKALSFLKSKVNILYEDLPVPKPLVLDPNVDLWSFPPKWIIYPIFLKIKIPRYAHLIPLYKVRSVLVLKVRIIRVGFLIRLTRPKFRAYPLTRDEGFAKWDELLSEAYDRRFVVRLPVQLVKFDPAVIRRTLDAVRLQRRVFKGTVVRIKISAGPFDTPYEPPPSQWFLNFMTVFKGYCYFWGSLQPP
jgi:hypothetical protein